MRPNVILTLIYSVIVLAGGIIGYLKAGSYPSLIMGVTASLLLDISIFLMVKENKWGQELTLGVTGVLLAFFGYRFVETGKFMPAGMMAVVSFVVLMSLLYCKTRCCEARARP